MPLENDTEDQGLDSTPDTDSPEIEETESQGSEEEQLAEDATEQDDSQDQSEDEASEENPEEEPDDGIKEAKSGNFDWKKINQKLGNGELEKSFKESQRQISKISQENKQLREQVGGSEQLKEAAQNFQYFDQLVARDPVLKAQVQAALARMQGGASQPMEEKDPFAEFNPNDPALPLLREQQRMLSELAQQSQQGRQAQAQAQYKDRFAQGLRGAKEDFKSRVGRDPTQDELRRVAEKMQQTGVLDGNTFVPALFFAEIEKSIRNKFFADRKEKKSLTKNPKGSSGATTKTGKPKTLRQEMDEDWAKLMGSD